MSDCFCNLCTPVLRLSLEELPAHLRVEHDVDMERDAAKWPDGEYVIVDNTLEPDDFAPFPRGSL